MRQTSITIAFIGLLVCASVGAQEAMVRAEYIEGHVIDRTSGLGLSKVEIKLFAPDGTLMDIGETDDKGAYRLDLGVLDLDEYKLLKTFYIVVADKKGRSARQSVSKGTILRSGVMKFPFITLP